MNNLFSIKDNVVVITGGTGVLGTAIAKYLAQEGAKVVILGRRKDEGERIVAEIKADGGEAMFLVTDVMNPETVQANCDEIMAAYGKIDALLNAAGGNMPGATIAPTGNFFDVKIEAFQKVLDLNLTGTVIPTQVFLKPMVEARQGRDCKLLVDGRFPPHDPRVGLCRRQGRYIELHRLPRQRSGRQVYI